MTEGTNGEKREMVIGISIQLSGEYSGELPKESLLRRKIWNLAEDKGRLSIDEFEFNVCKAEQSKELEDKDD